MNEVNLEEDSGKLKSNVLLKTFREVVKKGRVNIPTPESNVVFRGILGRGRSSTLQMFRVANIQPGKPSDTWAVSVSLDKNVYKEDDSINSAKSRISSVDKSPPVLKKMTYAWAVSASLGKNVYKEDHSIKSINSRISSVGKSPPVLKMKISDAWALSASLGRNVYTEDYSIKSINSRISSVDERPPVLKKITDTWAVSASLGKNVYKEDDSINSAKSRISSVDKSPPVLKMKISDAWALSASLGRDVYTEDDNIKSINSRISSVDGSSSVFFKKVKDCAKKSKEKKTKKDLNEIWKRITRDGEGRELTQQQIKMKLLKAKKKGKLAKVLKKFCPPSSSTDTTQEVKSPEEKEPIDKQPEVKLNSKTENGNDSIKKSEKHEVEDPKKRNSHTFTFGKLLGEGSFGRVWQAKDSMGRKCAVKVVKKRGADADDATKKEISILKLIKNLECGEFFCSELIKSYNRGRFRYLQFPLYGPTLSKMLEIDSGEEGMGARGFLIPQIRDILRQLFTALNFLHSHSIMHTDLKTDNILFLEGEWVRAADNPTRSFCVKMINPEIRLIDFGLAIRRRENQEITKNMCCLMYRPPECALQLKNEISYPVDIWCTGLVTVAMYLGRELFRKTDSSLGFLAQMEAAIGKFPKRYVESDGGRKYFANGSTKRPRDFPHYLIDETVKLHKLKRTKASLETDKLFELIGHMLKIDCKERFTSAELLLKVNQL